MFEIRGIRLGDSGKTIGYDYSFSGSAAPFFKENELFRATYDCDMSQVPAGIGYIPLLANVAPIAWFAGFDISVPVLDRDFYQALADIRKEWEIHYPQIESVRSEIRVGHLTDDKFPGGTPAMLFSGGVDAFATFFRLYGHKPALITIHGADITLEDQKQWDNVVRFNQTEPVLAPNAKHAIASNLRTFYNYKVDQLLESLAWWGNIQHGLALIGLTAPLSFAKGYDKIYIASTRSSHMEFNPWGSMPEIDNRVKWAGVTAIHDGFELMRQDKVDQIVRSANDLGTDVTLRVCYSDVKDGLNCSVCEKCLRTMFGIILTGSDPRRFGFNADASVYLKIEKAIGKGFKSRGTQFFWSEMLAKARKGATPFVFGNAADENASVQKILALIAQGEKADLIVPSGMQKIKHVLINRYPKLFGAYLRIRRAI